MTAPVAQPFSVSEDEDTPVLVTLQGSDPEEDLDYYEIVDGPANGVVMPVGDGGIEEYVYRPNANFHGTDSFTYRVFAGGEFSDTVTVDITINSVPDLPVINEGVGPVPAALTGPIAPGDLTAVTVLNDGSYVVVWDGFNQFGDTDSGIFMQRYDNTGAQIGSAARVNTTVTDYQYDPSIAALSDGGFVITWTSYAQDGDAEGIFMQRYLANGTAIGGERLVNGNFAGNQYASDVAGNADGGFMVVWGSDHSGSSHIYAQQFDEFGATVGGEDQIDTMGPLLGLPPSVIALNSSEYVVSWTGNDDDGMGVFAMRYHISGEGSGSIPVNLTTAGDQSRSEAVQLENGGFVIAFVEGSPGSFSGITLRLFDQFGQPQQNDIVVSMPGEVGASLALAPLQDGGFVLWSKSIVNGETQTLLHRFNAAGDPVGTATQVNGMGIGGEGQAALALLPNGQVIAAFSEFVPEAGMQVLTQNFSFPPKHDSFAEGGSIPNVLPDVTITDADLEDITSVKVQIVSGYQAGDRLFVKVEGTFLNVDIQNDVLTIFADAPRPAQEFEEVLRTLSFGAANGGATMERTLEVIAQGADGDSAPLVLNLKIQQANQYIPGVANADYLLGGTGIDTLNGLDGNDTLHGNGGDDFLSGGRQRDVLYGGDGNDRLDGGYDADTMYGGSGEDTYIVNSASDVIIELQAQGYNDLVWNTVSYTLPDYVEHMTLAGNKSINGTGNAHNNVLTGNGGDNQLFGEDGHDTLRGNNGDDTLTGGSGFDTLIGGKGDDHYYIDAFDYLVEAGSNAGGIDTVYADFTYRIQLEIENLRLTGTGNINGFGNNKANEITGNDSNNKISGGNGNDTLYGAGGNDTLIGGNGFDDLYGGAGNDVYYVETYMDYVIEYENEGFDTVYASSEFYLWDHVENLVLTSNYGVYAGGNDLSNKITGTGYADIISGYAGNDTLIGNDGDDGLYGGIGSDYLLGGNGADYLVGGEGYDWLYGSEGGDTLIGNNGNDWLYGGDGADILNGGIGSDTFVITATPDGGSNISMIADFAPGIDRIHLDDAVFALAAGALDASAFTAGSAATTSEHRIIFDADGGYLYYDADGVGGVDQQLFAVILNLATISEGDISVV